MLDPRFTFDSFVVGPSNRLAAAAARRAAESPGTSYNPLVIHSGPGLGKTHLLNAVGHLALSVRPELRVVYETLGRLVDRVTSALAGGAIEAFREEFRSVDLLLLDDIQFLAGKARSQEELLRVWDEMVRSGAQVVLASDRTPQEIDGLDARLASRLSGGLIVDLAPPEVETRIAILRRKAEERGVVLGPAVIDALARLSWTSVRELQGGLNRLLALQETEGREVAPEEVAPFLGMQPGGQPPEDEFGTFLLDISSTVAQLVESAPWRRVLGEAILRWEGEGIRTRRLEQALEADSPPDVEALLGTFAADVERLRAAEDGVRALDPEAASSPLFRDPDRAEDAEALLAAARAAAVPLPDPPAGSTLDEVVGRLGEDSLAARAARRALGRPASGNNPLFLHAPHGGDATELLAAIGRAALAERPGARVAYVRAGALPDEIAPALRARAGEIWRRRYHGVDLLLLDALHELRGDARVQEEVFYLLDALLRSDAQLVVAADRPPRDLAALDARLRSRLEGGLVVDLARPVPQPAQPAPAARAGGDGTDRWFYNPEKVAWSALALEDRLIEELA